MHETASWRRPVGNGNCAGNRRLEMVTMTVPGETEAGSAGMQPCRGITWRAHRDDDRSAEVPLPRSSKNQDRIGRPRCLENPRPKGGMLTNGERPLSISR